MKFCHEQDEVTHVNVVAEAVNDEKEVTPVLRGLDSKWGWLRFILLIILLLLFLGFLFLCLIFGFFFLCISIFSFCCGLCFQCFCLFLDLLRFFLFSSNVCC